jgi:hypothetical protein
MRVFQVSGTRPWYRARLDQLTADKKSFAELLAEFHNDGFDAVHTLAPVLASEEYAFFTHADNVRFQRAWARENGLSANTDLEGILLAQVEAHRTEVFYCMSAPEMDRKFISRLPGSVTARICFNASPSVYQDMSACLVVCNVPHRIECFRRQGLRSAYFAPCHAPIQDEYARNDDRDVDVLFAGTYSRHHKIRSRYLDAVAGLQKRFNVVFALQQSRLNRVAESPLGWVGPLRKYSRPSAVRKITQGPVFGRAYYALLARSKIVLNGAPDISGNDRGNMRCWEALGSRSLMVSDTGNYPEGMVDGKTIRTFGTAEEAVSVIGHALAHPDERQQIANAGYDMVRTRYSKARQWADFQKLVADYF